MKLALLNNYMKVVNYKKGNYFYAFDCVIYGHIEMTWKEWMSATKYLLLSGGDVLQKRMLREDIIRKDKDLEDYNGNSKTTWRNVRVTYTEKLFNHYKLPRYKKQNYAIRIICS